MGVCLLLVCGGQAFSDTSHLLAQLHQAQSQSSVSNLSVIGIEIEKLSTNDLVQYCKFHEALEATLERMALTNAHAMQELQSQVENSMAKACSKTAAETVMCFQAKHVIAQRILRTSAPNLHHAKMVASYLGEVRLAMIPGYKPAEVELNVLPPVGKGPRIAGMDPKAIRDPDARREYERAISENNERAQLNELQLVVLPNIERTMKRAFVDYTRKLFAQVGDAKTEAGVLAGLARLTELEKAELEKTAH
jgi:hypothetical protein